MKIPLILASQSPARVKLLEQVKVSPDHIIPSDIDEDPKKGEKGRELALRLSKEKAHKVAESFDKGIIIAADTVPVCRGRIIDKALSKDDIIEMITILSGRRHQIYTAVCIIKKDVSGTKVAQKVIKTVIKFRSLTKKEIEHYASLGEGIGKAGGYTLTGYAESFVSFISGSFSNVIGLPLYETTNILRSFGYYTDAN